MELPANSLFKGYLIYKKNMYISKIEIHNELEDITCCLASNKLSLNMSKTKYMIYHINDRKVIHPDLKINDCINEREADFLISANANWNCHIDQVS